MVGRDITKSISMDLGNFSSSYSLLIGIPQGVASAMSASMLPSVVASFTDRDYDSMYIYTQDDAPKDDVYAPFKYPDYNASNYRGEYSYREKWW